MRDRTDVYLPVPGLDVDKIVIPTAQFLNGNALKPELDEKRILPGSGPCTF